MVITSTAEFHEHDDGEGGVGGSEVGDGLRLAIFDDPKIIPFKPGDEVAVLRSGHDVECDDGDFDGDGDASLLRVLLGGRRRRLHGRLRTRLLTCGRLREGALLGQRQGQRARE